MCVLHNIFLVVICSIEFSIETQCSATNRFRHSAGKNFRGTKGTNFFSHYLERHRDNFVVCGGIICILNSLYRLIAFGMSRLGPSLFGA